MARCGSEASQALHSIAKLCARGAKAALNAASEAPSGASKATRMKCAPVS